MEYPHYRVDIWPGTDRVLRATLTRVDDGRETVILGRRPEQGPISGTALPAATTLAVLQATIDQLISTYWDDPDLHN